jgi:hypothetical protein
VISIYLESCLRYVMELLPRIRNMWQFANLCQWIYIFGDAISINVSIDIEVSEKIFLLCLYGCMLMQRQYIEAECLKPSSPGLNDIALALLKTVTSHRGLTYAYTPSHPPSPKPMSDG